MKYDDVLSELGDFGKYQKIVYMAVCLPLMFEGMQIMSPVFILASPKHRCAIPGLLNDSFEIQSNAHASLIRRYIPVNEEGEYFRCDIYRINDTSVIIDNYTSLETEPCDRWVYDKTEFQDTVITETNQVCSSTIYRAHATVAMNIGALFSFITLGTVADRYGRKQATIGELIVMGVFSCLLVWLPNIYVFIVIRLFIGIGFGVFYNSCFVYAMEFVGPSKRTLCGMLQNFFWAVGILIQAALAYFIRTWRAFQLTTSIPIFGILMYWWYLPNSGRWLMSKGHLKECQQVFQRMAEVNKRKFNLDLLSIQLDDTTERKPQSFLKIFKSRRLAIRTLIVFWNWYTVSLLYIGLSLNVGNLSGNIYANFAISCVMETIGYALCFPGLYKLGRKKFHCICMITGGLVLLVSIIPQVHGTEETQWSIVLLAMVGKLVSSAAYATIYLFSAELFPTVVRSRSMGISAACATTGAMTAPYIIELVNILDGVSGTVLPLVIFGVTSLSAGLLSTVLPETQKSQLPDTIEDMKQQGKR